MSEEQQPPQKGMRTEVLIAIITAVSTIFVAIITILPNFVDRGGDPAALPTTLAQADSSMALTPMPTAAATTAAAIAEATPLSIAPTTQAAEPTKPLAPTQAAPTTRPAQQATTDSSVLQLDQVVEGTLADKQIVAYTIAGSANTPLLIDLQAKNSEGANANFSLHLRILDSKKLKLSQHDLCCSRSLRIPFTPPADGQYTIELTGTSSYGTYSIVPSLLAGKASTSGTATALSLDQPYEAQLAAGSVDLLSLAGSANTPLLLDLQLKDGENTGQNFTIHLRILDNKKTELLNRDQCCSRSLRIPFTPPADGQYTVEVSSTSSYGDYMLVASLLAGDASTRGTVTALSLDQPHEGKLAADSVDMVSIIGTANTSLVLELQLKDGENTGQNFTIHLRVLDARENELANTDVCCSRSGQVSFTPPADGEYIVELSGVASYGDYILSLSQP